MRSAPVPDIASRFQLQFPYIFLVVVLLLAGCATPMREPGTAEPESAASASAPGQSPAVAQAPKSGDGPFAPDVRSQLKPLPPPAEDLWMRIRKGYGMQTLDNAYVTKWEQWYSSRPDYVARMIDRSRRYLYYIVVEVEKRGMPLEVALLPMVESAYNPIALSTARAAGIWQFMPGTGKDYGMKQTFWFDSRRDVIAATDGALAYLQKLYAMFNDWQLALAAYNWGEGNVARAIERNQRAGKPTDYASLQMPDETRNYLPKLQAVKNIINDPGQFNLELANIPDAPYFAIVRTTREMDVKRVAELAEMSVEEFQYLNPHHNRPVIAGADQYEILLPIDKAELFAAKLDLLDQPLVSWQAYYLRQGETLQQVAAKFGMEVETLKAVNGIGAKARVPVGHALLVPATQDPGQAEASLASAVFTTVPQGRTFYYAVVRGDTLTGIAARFNVTTTELRSWNDLGQRALVAGQRLRITSDLAPTADAANRPGGAKVVATTSVTRSKPRAANGKGKTGAATPQKAVGKQAANSNTATAKSRQATAH